MRSLKKVLMERDGMTERAALVAIEKCRSDFYKRLESADPSSAYYVMEKHFGLEPDFLDEFI